MIDFKNKRIKSLYSGVCIPAMVRVPTKHLTMVSEPAVGAKHLC